MLRDSGSAELGWAPAGPGGAILAGGDVGLRAGHARPGLHQVLYHPPGGPARWTEATSPVRPRGGASGPRRRRPGHLQGTEPLKPLAGSLPPAKGAGRGTRGRA
uniref:Uncharacterized protein n=1 Tax=Castor canadensis TaxID=51338 RepID=A0A8C0W6V3_CASCN